MDTRGPDAVPFPFRERLRDRIKKVMDQKQLAERLGVHPSTVTHWIRDGAEPDLRTLATVCELIETSSDYLLGLHDDPTPRDPSARTEELLEVRIVRTGGCIAEVIAVSREVK